MMDNCLPLYYWHAALHMMLFYMCIYMHGLRSQTPFLAFPYCMLKECSRHAAWKICGIQYNRVGLDMDLPGFIKSIYLRLLLFSCYRELRAVFASILVV